jgi:signal peptide peptidase SppA
MRTAQTDNQLPYDRFWCIQPAFKQHFRAAMPQLYAALRDEPRRFMELSRNGGIVPNSLLSLGPLTALRTGKPAGKKTGRKAEDGEGDYDNDGGEAEPLPEQSDGDEDDIVLDDCEGENDDSAPYPIVDGVALLSISGPMSKKPTSAMWLFGGTSTLIFRKLLNHAAANPRVGAILIDYDTPGGTVAGTADLSDAIARVAKKKIVEGFAPDLCASAGVWTIAPSRKITIGRTCQFGSIGVYMVVEDWSKMYSEAGVTVHVVHAGDYKGAGEDGTEVTPEQLAEWQREINSLNVQFCYSVQTYRKLTDAQMTAANTGQCWTGQEAVNMGLADAVGTYEETLSRLAREVALGGLVTYPNAIPGAGTRSGTGTASRTVPPVNAGTPKTGDPVIAAIGSALERHTAENPIFLLNASETAPEPAAVSGETTGEPTAILSPEIITNTPPEPAATEENDSMDPKLVAALTEAGITTLEAFRALAVQASEGQTARKKAIGQIKDAATRLQGADVTDGTNYEEIYGAMPISALWNIAAQMDASYKAMMKHPAQSADPNLLGQRMTQPSSTENLAPAIAAALTKDTGLTAPALGNLSPIDPDKIVAGLNAARDAAAKNALGKK